MNTLAHNQTRRRAVLRTAQFLLAVLLLCAVLGCSRKDPEIDPTMVFTTAAPRTTQAGTQAPPGLTEAPPEGSTAVPDSTDGSGPGSGIDRYDLNDLTGSPADGTEPATTVPPTTAPPTTQARVFTEKKAILYASDNVRVREQPAGEVLGQLSIGTKVEQLAVSDDGWSRVRWQGREAYVASQYLTDKAPETTAPETTTAADSHPVAGYAVAQRCEQFILVTAPAAGTDCKIAMYQKIDGQWKTLMTTNGKIAYNGLYKEREGDNRTPVGAFSIIKAFGRNPDPGCALGYTQVDDTMHWVDDPESKYYNKFVSTADPSVTPDWTTTEHLIDKIPSYNYCLAINYNYPECTPYRGCAIFLHGFNSDRTPTHGCIAMSEDSMKYLVTHVKSGCRVVIGEESKVSGY
ncbi:MAG: L,D-transpeptidase family protein [Lachnospiraceae bacterium]|nr:L,D-transpeptidase family protein [Lachnospiraceae bacterium]